MSILISILVFISMSFAKNTQNGIASDMVYDNVIHDIRSHFDGYSSNKHIDEEIKKATEYVLWENRRTIMKTIEVKMSSEIAIPNDICMILSVEHCNPTIGCKLIGHRTEVPNDIHVLAWEYNPYVLKIYNLDDTSVDDKSIIRINYLSFSSVPQFVDTILNKSLQRISK